MGEKGGKEGSEGEGRRVRWKGRGGGREVNKRGRVRGKGGE